MRQRRKKDRSEAEETEGSLNVEGNTVMADVEGESAEKVD